MKYISSCTFFILFVTLFWVGCSTGPSNGIPEITYAKAEDFADTGQVAIELAEGFEIDLWAPGPLIANAVAISFDNHGVAYVAETSRRKSSDIDIRQHRGWMTEDLGLQTIEDTEAFHKRKLDPSLSDKNTWQEDFNGDSIHDWHDLMVETEYIRRIWDSDGDGRADASSIYAQSFKDMLTGVAGGILYQDGEVFLTAAPDLWKLKDIDGDGDADQQSSISHGYGIHIAYAGHDMSGLVMGPDGKIYWSIGDIGVNVVDKVGKRWAYPHEGAVMRINPDGSDFEVFAHGLRNPQELAFDAYGNLISVDNDGDHAGEHERYVHIIEGSDSGWRINWQFGKYDNPNEEYKVWMDEKLYVPHFSGQAAYLLPPLALAPDGPAGLAYNPGTALGERWKGYFFGSFFKGSSAQSKIEAFKLKPRGASFEVDTKTDIVKGIVSTGVSFGPEGALYINDWLDGYALKPQGRIWKLDVEAADKNPLRVETFQLLQKGMKDVSSGDLAVLMAHDDMRVRMGAQFELVRRQELELLLTVAEKSEYELAQLHAIWGIGQLAQKDDKRAAILIPLLLHFNEHIRSQAAKVLGEAQYALALDGLLNQLKDSSARVQFFVAEALGKLGNARAFQPLVELLQKVGDSDPHLRHAIVYALSRLNAEDQIAELSTHESKDVRIGAVVALRHMKSPKAANFLQDEDLWVVVEAARTIHDDQSIPAALPALASALNRTEITDEAFIRRAINANLRLGGKESAQRLVTYATAESAPEAMRADALWALGYWPEPPVLDRVEGCYRELPSRELSEAHIAIAPIMESLIQDKKPSIRAAAIEASGRLMYGEVENEIFRLLTTKNQDKEVKKAIIGALAALKSEHLVAALNTTLKDKTAEVRTYALELILNADLPPTTVVEMLSKVIESGSISEQQTAFASLGDMKAKEAEILLSNWLERLQQGAVDKTLQLDILMAAENHGGESLLKGIADYEATKQADNILDTYKESLYGGDVDRGGRIFTRNNTAQCIRCHQIFEYGGEVGPNLTKIGAQLSREELLASLVDPNARLAPGYGTVVLKLKNGEQVVGTNEGESGGKLKVKEASGVIKEVALDDISERQDAPSAMISMEGVLSKAEIRDIVAFLAHLK